MHCLWWQEFQSNFKVKKQNKWKSHAFLLWYVQLKLEGKHQCFRLKKKGGKWSGTQDWPYIFSSASLKAVCHMTFWFLSIRRLPYCLNPLLWVCYMMCFLQQNEDKMPLCSFQAKAWKAGVSIHSLISIQLSDHAWACGPILPSSDVLANGPV